MSNLPILLLCDANGGRPVNYEIPPYQTAVAWLTDPNNFQLDSLVAFDDMIWTPSDWAWDMLANPAHVRPSGFPSCVMVATLEGEPLVWLRDHRPLSNKENRKRSSVGEHTSDALSAIRNASQEPGIRRRHQLLFRIAAMFLSYPFDGKRHQYKRYQAD